MQTKTMPIRVRFKVNIQRDRKGKHTAMYLKINCWLVVTQTLIKCINNKILHI